MAFQINSTNYCAIKAIFYEMVFNRKPCFERLSVANHYFTKTNIKKYIYDDDQDDFWFAEDREGQQLETSSEQLV